MLNLKQLETKNDFLVSVIIPNYNRQSLLIKAIKSILAQTYLPKEILIIDDMSNYDIKELIKKTFTREFQNNLIKVQVNDQNYGAAVSRNIGINKSNYKFLAFLDSDDYWQPTKLEKQIKKFMYNHQLDLVYCDQYLVKDGNILKSDKTLIKSDILYNLTNFWTAPNPSTLLFKKESLLKLGGFDTEVGRSCSDHYLWFKMAINNFKIDFVNEPLSYFFLDSSDRNSYNLTNRLNSAKILLKKVKKYISKKKFYIFKSKYILAVTTPIFFREMKKKNYLILIKIYMQYLIFNIFFYKKIFYLLKKRLF